MPSPCYKTGHATRELAQAAVVGIKRTGSPKKGRTLSSYHCPNCGLWHVGHNPIRKLKRRRR
jgi:hypothetical protein